MTTDGLEAPDVIQAWVRQLLDPEVIDFVRRYADGHQLDIRLSASRGRVRARPALALNDGPQALLTPQEAAEL